MATLTTEQYQELRTEIYSMLGSHFRTHPHADNNAIYSALDDVMEIIDGVLKDQ